MGYHTTSDHIDRYNNLGPGCVPHTDGVWKANYTDLRRDTHILLPSVVFFILENPNSVWGDPKKFFHDQGGYNRSYVGLTDTIYKAEDIKYDARYHQIKGEKARRDQMRADWLKNFTTLDDPKKRPIDSVSEASTSAVPAKKVRIVRFEDVLEAFSNAETLSSNTLEKLVKHLRSEHELKKTPSVELLRKMQLYRSITGPAVTPYHFYKWWRFLHESSKDEVVELMDIEMQAAELILKERRERRKAVAQEPVEPEKKSYMSLFLNENECADGMDVCHRAAAMLMELKGQEQVE